MFSHIRDLIRQRKEQRQKKKLLKKSFKSGTTIIHDDDSTICYNNSISKTSDSLVVRLVQETNARKSILPTFIGLDRFELIKKIGDGAFSNVFEALDFETGKKIALKVAQKKINKNKDQKHLHSSLIKKQKVTERSSIIKEVQIMKQIKHPNIVQLIHFTETDENYFLALELCNGGELFYQIVKLTYFSESLSRHVIIQVAKAVRYLHKELGVVHRDIKPENILFDKIPIVPSKKRTYRPTDNKETKEDEGEFRPGVGGGGIGQVKLADFGLSKVIWNNSTFTPCGTVGYTAPEVVLRDTTYSKSVDMWALGCVLYTILCGFPPFYDESIPELTTKVARGQYTFLSPWWDTISNDVKDLISHLLCVDVTKRYTIEEFFEHPWIKQQQDTVQKQPIQHEDEAIAAIIQDNSNYATPDAATLRGIFDITYAVQRMGEEYPSPPLTSEENNQKKDLAKELAKKKIAQQDNEIPLLPTKNNFQLDMNNATLLNKRKNK